MVHLPILIKSRDRVQIPGVLFLVVSTYKELKK